MLRSTVDNQSNTIYLSIKCAKKQIQLASEVSVKVSSTDATQFSLAGLSSSVKDNTILSDSHSKASGEIDINDGTPHTDDSNEPAFVTAKCCKV